MHAEPWPGDKANLLASMAAQAFEHNHPTQRGDKLTTRNCQACCLRGLHADRNGAPNVAGWERLYVQTLRRMPLAMLDAALQSNKGTEYAAALARDVMTWGIPIDGPANGGRAKTP